MENLDDLKFKKEETIKALADAMKSDDEAALAKAMMALSQDMHDRIMAEAKGVLDSNDVSVLASRGDKALTSEETVYYKKLITCMKATDPKMELSNIDPIMPFTIIERVFEDLTVAHPILSEIKFEMAPVTTTWVMHDHERQLAVWGDIFGPIVGEISSAFRSIDTGMCKLTAFMFIHKDMLDLGPRWVDRYVRTILAEAWALAMEKAILIGDGNGMPIGMNRELPAGESKRGGHVYAEKTPVKLTSFDPVTYGAFLADHLATTENGNPRAVPTILAVVNPTDYLRKVFPATTIRTPDGRYVNDVFPFPTKVIQSVMLPQGRAILGIAARYWMGVGTNQRIEFSDEYKFLEDLRTYAIKSHSNGMPMDNVSFVWVDISELEPLVQQVYVTNMAAMPEA